MDDVIIYLKDIVKETIPIALAAWFALSLYYKQREYEAIKDRYLDGGFDLVSAGMADTIDTIRNNWARLLYLSKEFEAFSGCFDDKRLEDGFLEFNVGKLEMVANQRVHFLTRSGEFWIAYQKLLAFAKIADDFMKREATYVMAYNKNATRVAKKLIVLEIRDELERIDTKLNSFQILLEQVLYVGQVFEREKHSFKSLDDFFEKPDVKDAIKNAQNVLTKL